eukprot:SAG22_NODE_1196_length_5198_cov_3.167092_5_plen_98_part_00
MITAFKREDCCLTCTTQSAVKFVPFENRWSYASIHAKTDGGQRPFANPCRQLHANWSSGTAGSTAAPADESLHAAPFAHGLEAHSSKSTSQRPPVST